MHARACHSQRTCACGADIGRDCGRKGRAGDCAGRIREGGNNVLAASADGRSRAGGQRSGRRSLHVQVAGDRGGGAARAPGTTDAAVGCADADVVRADSQR